MHRLTNPIDAPSGKSQTPPQSRQRSDRRQLTGRAKSHASLLWAHFNPPDGEIRPGRFGDARSDDRDVMWAS
ncbi:hypothetical protein EYF80_044620 [Liparis tanakae]|uniref:Uncharacterized protein n=1 Tax=Liparis tanakae TaxID=230148 RepID=A0A4Z2FW82_9TELE|nr:hypothetical protein EYF80_044620 [Liparis tanakae]